MDTQTLAFLRALYEGVEEGFITLTAIHPLRQHAAPSRHVHIKDVPALTEALHHLEKANQQGWGAYFAVALRHANLGRWRRGGKRDLLSLPALWVDIDTEPETALIRLRNFAIPPSCVIRSGGGVHGYWFLRPTGAFADADNALRGLAATLGGDKTNVAQSLRLPGSINTKPARNGAVCKIIDLHPERRYSLSDFKKQIAYKQPQTRSNHPRRILMKGDLNPSLIHAVSDCLLSEYRGFIKPNGYLAALCPCGHCHDLPGSHFYFDTTRALGICFGRHGRLLLKDLCEVLRIDPVRYGGFYR